MSIYLRSPHLLESCRQRLATAISSRSDVAAAFDGDALTLRLLRRFHGRVFRGRLRVEMKNDNLWTRLNCTTQLTGPVVSTPVFIVLIASTFPAAALALNVIEGKPIPNEVWSFAAAVLAMGGMLYAINIAIALGEQSALLRFVRRATQARHDPSSATRRR